MTDDQPDPRLTGHETIYDPERGGWYPPTEED